MRLSQGATDYINRMADEMGWPSPSSISLYLLDCGMKHGKVQVA